MFVTAVSALCLLSLFSVSVVVLASPGFLHYADFAAQPYKVSYNSRSLLLNNQASLFVSGSIHYPRSTPEQWPMLLQRAVDNGLNLIQIYTFWNYHQPIDDQHTDWTGRGNLTRFLQLAAQHNLFVNFRLGPYVCAEWDWGGLPAWLSQQPNMIFRSNTGPWKNAVMKWVNELITEVRPFFSDRGGPIILAQIENELHGGDHPYAQWCGDYVNSLGVGAIWIMCNGDTANNTVNTCNGHLCPSTYLEQHGQTGRILVDQPAIWTEDEEGFTSWGDSPTTESQHPAGLAYGLARWFALGGSVSNLYMWHGGNHYNRTHSGGVATNYANSASLGSDGFPNEPKYSHLTQLYRTLASLADTIVNLPAQLDKSVPVAHYDGSKWVYGPNQRAWVYGSVAFVESNQTTSATIQWSAQQYTIQPNSILIINGTQLLYDTSAVPAPATHRVYTTVPLTYQWSVWQEPYALSTPNYPLPLFNSSQPLEQLHLTVDRTDYLLYTREFALQNPLDNAELSIDSTSANAFLIFIDGMPVAQTFDTSHTGTSVPLTLTTHIPHLSAGTHTILLVSISLGIDNSMPTDDTPAKSYYKGIVGNIRLGSIDLTSGAWQHQVFLLGEYLQLNTIAGSKKVAWNPNYQQATQQPFYWYQTDVPAVSIPMDSELMLNATGLGRGHYWLNGFDCGRYWMLGSGAQHTGPPTQSLYHIPRDWVNTQSSNHLVFLEEEGTVDITLIQLQLVSIQAIQQPDTLAAE